MLRSNLRLIVRQMLSIYSFINLTGLIIGFSIFTLIFLWVNDELSYDRFHPGYMDIYRTVKDTYDEKGIIYPVAVTPGPLSEYLRTNYAEVLQACRLTPVEFCIKTEVNCFYKKGIVADTSFFSLFNFPLVEGSRAGFKTGTDKIIISRSLAQTFFGTENAIGKIFIIGPRELAVVAIMDNVPSNTHIPEFDYVIPIEFMQVNGIDDFTDWDYSSIYTYIKLKPSAQKEIVEGKIKNSIIKNSPESTSLVKLQPLGDIHLKSNHLNNDMKGQGNSLYVKIFSVVAFLVLIIASINYSNLATARSIKRSKETGVRKVLGSSRMQLISFFFSESIFYCLLALLVAIFLSWSLLPYFNELNGKKLELQLVSATIFVPLLLSALLCALLAGTYPALILSAQNPVAVFKGLATSGKKAVNLRRVLVVAQFILSIGLLTATLLIQRQLAYINSKNLGYDKENIISFTAVRKIQPQYATFKNELLNLPQVKSVTANSASISFTDQSTSDVVWEGKKPDQELIFNTLIVDYDYLNTYSIQLSSGRDFSTSFASDSSGILINEEAVSKMGLREPLNQEITFHEKKYTILGIMKDFHFKSIHKKVEPLLLYIDPAGFYNISVKLNKGNLQAHVKAVEAVFKKFVPERPFNYTFLDEEVQDLYLTEKRTGIIFQYLAAFSIFVSCLGLLGIIMFVTEQRTKELAVRKVMGASVLKLMWMLSSEYFILVILSFCIAAPLMYYAVDAWLANFAYRVEIDVWIFFAAGLLSLAFALLTIAYRAYKAAVTNPINSLRIE